ncbi:hypothetical protein OUZ56_011506 [Daphnia magna]|uniref:Reverse transcriptase/retrotransposon-derived protein RNase H-like domain-containing protein n=1 Tax=Daphnia magna TaxID=35525 RepID=A0ABQ9Z0B5_9CRUS|nr:hypothetical protein OUZ56_011506 [Daphnia magna]
MLPISPSELSQNDENSPTTTPETLSINNSNSPTLGCDEHTSTDCVGSEEDSMFQPRFNSTQKPKRLRVDKSHIQSRETELAIASVNSKKLPSSSSNHFILTLPNERPEDWEINQHIVAAMRAGKLFHHTNAFILYGKFVFDDDQDQQTLKPTSGEESTEPLLCNNGVTINTEKIKFTKPSELFGGFMFSSTDFLSAISKGSGQRSIIPRSYARASLSASTKLSFHDPALTTALHVDAYRLRGLGFILLQQNPNKEGNVIQAGSRFLSEAELSYVMIELECMEAAWAMQKCHPDTKRLQPGHAGKSADPSITFKDAVLNLICKLGSRKSKRTADALSRAPVNPDTPTNELAEGPTSFVTRVAFISAITGSDINTNDPFLLKIAAATAIDPIMIVLREVCKKSAGDRKRRRNDRCLRPIFHPQSRLSRHAPETSPDAQISYKAAPACPSNSKASRLCEFVHADGGTPVYPAATALYEGHRSSPASHLKALTTPGVIVDVKLFCDYLIKMPAGRLFRRNRHFLRHCYMKLAPTPAAQEPPSNNLPPARITAAVSENVTLQQTLPP